MTNVVMSSIPPLKTALSELAFPFLDLKAEYAAMREEVLATVARVLDSQQFILGPEVEAFEAEAAELVGCRFAIGCASGSDALLLALMALEIGPGDEVITTPFTFFATAGAIAQRGARPVMVDISGDFNLDPGQIQTAITPRTRAIMPVHLFGLAAEMDAILELGREFNLPVIEDAAQAIGARYHDQAVGGLGTAGCFSFFPSKNLGGAGDGGMITTQDAALAERLRLLRVHGSRNKYEYELLGVNSRLDGLQAAILRVKLRHLTEWTSARRSHAERYADLFNEFGLADIVQLPGVPTGRDHVYNQFVIRTPRRDELRTYLRQHGIPTEIYYPYPLHLQPAFSFLGYKAGQMPRAEAACAEVLALPISPKLTAEQQQRVVAGIAAFFKQIASRLAASQ
jgi:dTDP-4-amino-4,6-dideoxygalactose transaminase